MEQAQHRQNVDIITLAGIYQKRYRLAYLDIREISITGMILLW